MDLKSEITSKIQELQSLEQNLQAFLSQKQNIQVELNETLNALSELSKADGEVYKILSGVMIRSSRDSVAKELEEKRKLLDLRISSIEKQEKIVDDRTKKMKEEINKLIEKDGEKK